MSKKLQMIVKSKVRDLYNVFLIDEINTGLLTYINQKKYIYIIDENVYNLFKEELKISISSERYIFIKSCEENKQLDYAQIVIRKLIDLQIRKDDVLIAIGGGITQDIVTFISSILFRGIDWVFFPTTLLAQCDSCIGSKSSINFDNFKNLLGTFNPPSNIYICNKFLLTLNESEIRSGIGEMMHYFLFEGYDIAERLINNMTMLLQNPLNLQEFIIESLRIKKGIIEKDEFDIGIRHLFNYGHTFGHALESITNYKIPHGQAITLGMDLANYISFQRNILTEKDYFKMKNLLKYNTPDFKFNHNNIENYLNALAKDKKNKDNKLGCILSKAPGDLEKFYLDFDIQLKNEILQYSL